MPMILVECPYCGFEGKANLKLVGSEVGCRECGERFEIPLIPVMATKKEGSGVWKPIDAGVDISALAELERISGSVGPVKLEDVNRRSKAKAAPSVEVAEPVLPSLIKVKAEVDPFAPPADPTVLSATRNGGEMGAEADSAKVCKNKKGRSRAAMVIVVLILLALAAGGGFAWTQV